MAPIFRSVKSFLDCPNLPLDGLNCWLNAAVGVAVSHWTLFVHDFGWDVGASFVFDVNDTRLSVALWCHLSDDLPVDTTLCKSVLSA